VTDEQRNARYALAVLFGINLMNFFDRQIAGALLEPIRIEFGMSDTASAAVNTAFTLIYAFVGVPLGRLSDTWKRTRLIAIGVTFWSVLTATSGLAIGYWTYLLTRMGVGIGESSCAPAGQALIGDLYAPERRARAMGIFMMGLPLGLFASYLLSGSIAAAWGWRAAFFVACIPGLILATLAWRIREPARGASEAGGTAAQSGSFLSAVIAVLRIPTLWWIILSGIVFNFHAYAVNMFQSAFLQRFHGLGLADASRLSAFSLGLAGAVGLLVGGSLGDRLRTKFANGRLVLAAIGMLCAAPCIYTALEQPKGSVAVFAILMGASSACTFIYYATVYAAIQDVVAPHLRGMAVSVYFFAFYVLGASIGPMIMGRLSDNYAHEAMVAAGATEMAMPFLASGLHKAMYVMPLLVLLCAGALFGAATTVAKDMRRREGITEVGLKPDLQKT
jgi:predicted MFS family arabinose efflux permease